MLESSLGDNWAVDTEICKGLEKFTCHLYGLPRFNKVNKARLFKLRTMCGNKNKITRKSKIYLYRLPPCKLSLYPHINRENFQTGRLKLSHVKCPQVPSPSPDHGWLISEDGLLEPQWTSGDILPQQLVDVINPASGADHVSDSSDGESNEVESDSAPDSDYSDSDL